MRILFLMIFISQWVWASDLSFSSDISKIKWETNGDKNACRVFQNISDFGQASFTRYAGEYTVLELTSLNRLSKEIPGELTILPPSWKKDEPQKKFASPMLAKGKAILTIPAKETESLVLSMQSGNDLELSYTPTSTNHVHVIFHSLNFKLAYLQFLECIQKLLPYAFYQLDNMNIYFGINSIDLRDSDKTQLNKILEYKKAGGEFSQILVTGYSDYIGNRIYNRKLAVHRAESVQDYLVSIGFDKKTVGIMVGKEEIVKKKNKKKKGEVKMRRVVIQLIR